MQNKIENVTHELIYRHVYVNMFKIDEQHFIFIDINKFTLQNVEMRRLNTRLIFEIFQVFANQMIRINAEFLHEICIEDEYEVYVHAKTKKFVNRITITNVKIVQFVVKCIFFMNSQANDSQIKIEYRVIFTKLTRFRAYIQFFFEIDDF